MRRCTRSAAGLLTRRRLAVSWLALFLLIPPYSSLGQQATAANDGPGVPGHIVNCKPFCTVYDEGKRENVHNNQAVTILEIRRSETSGLTYAAIETSTGTVRYLPSIYVAQGPPSEDIVEIATKMVLYLAFSGLGIFLLYSRFRKDRKEKSLRSPQEEERKA